MVENIRPYDIVVFGASGYTGQYVIEELAVNYKNLKWAVAGRNKEKILSILGQIGTETKEDLQHIGILTADVEDDLSLVEMCKSTKVLVNCVGPYRFSGEKIVGHCVENKTHCVDVSGEPQFLESVQLKYFDAALAQGVYIVGSCGFDSIPADMGVEVIRKQFPGDLHSVETFLTAERPPGSTVNFGTWQSAIYGLAHAAELKPLRKELKEKVFTKTPPPSQYPLKPRGTLFQSSEVGGWCIPFIGSDRSVMLRTQMFNYQFLNQRPVQVQTYMKPYSFLVAVTTLLMGAIFMLMVKFPLGRYYLEKFPELFSLGVFSRTPPPKEKASSGSFSVTFLAKGWSNKMSEPTDQHTQSPDQTLTAVLKGPDPGYITTAICVILSAVVILEEEDKFPNRGGVLTPGSAFSQTTLMKRLENRGIKMRIEP